jgi:hypothetical protein
MKSPESVNSQLVSSVMLDTTKLPRSFSVPFGDQAYDFVVTGASDEKSLVLNVARETGGQRLQFGNGLTIDRHAGHFHFADVVQEDLNGQRPLAMTLNAIPARLLSVVWRMLGGLFRAAPGTFFVSGGEVALGWNLAMLATLIAIIAFALTVGLYVVAPLLAISAICFVLELAYFRPREEERAKAFMEGIAGNVRDLVEETVAH